MAISLPRSLPAPSVTRRIWPRSIRLILARCAMSPLDWSEGLEVAALDVQNGAYLAGLQRGGAIFKPAKGESYNILDIIRKTGAVFTGI